MKARNTFSLSMLHAPEAFAREFSYKQMSCELRALTSTRIGGELLPHGYVVHSRGRLRGTPWARFKTEIALEQWEYALTTPWLTTTHCVFLTDDLRLAPNFLEIVQAMIDARPTAIWGLMSNHPSAVRLFREGAHMYRCNSWVVGPAYIVPRVHLAPFVEWYKGLPDTEEPHKGRRWFDDDSALNEWITRHGPGESYHPLPAPIEHRRDIPTTTTRVPDRFTYERVSWRAEHFINPHEDGFIWSDRFINLEVAPLATAGYWSGDAGPLLAVGGAEETDAP